MRKKGWLAQGTAGGNKEGNGKEKEKKKKGTGQKTTQKRKDQIKTVGTIGSFPVFLPFPNAQPPRVRERKRKGGHNRIRIR